MCLWGINKYDILFASFGWSVYKGLDIIVELSKELNDNYQIVVVGTNDEVDKILSDIIIKIHRTNNQNSLLKYIHKQMSWLILREKKCLGW